MHLRVFSFNDSDFGFFQIVKAVHGTILIRTPQRKRTNHPCDSTVGYLVHLRVFSFNDSDFGFFQIVKAEHG
jgi:hypothetical protein